MRKLRHALSLVFRAAVCWMVFQEKQLDSVKQQGLSGKFSAAFMLAGCMAMTTTALLAQDARGLNIYNWSDYIALDTIQNFVKETGIKLRHPAPGHPGLHQFQVWLVGAFVA